jgi:hypothetical protein
MNPRMMKVEQMRQRLIAAGRLDQPSSQPPYAFEKRIMARITSRQSLDPYRLWNRILWRCAGPCVALVVVLGALSFVHGNESLASGDYVADLETLVYAPLNTTQEVW